MVLVFFKFIFILSLCGAKLSIFLLAVLFLALFWKDRVWISFGFLSWSRSSALRQVKWVFTSVMGWPSHTLYSLERMLPWMDRMRRAGCYLKLSGFGSRTLRKFLSALYADSQTWVRLLQEALKRFWRALDKVALMASKPSVLVHVQVNRSNSIALAALPQRTSSRLA